MKKVFFINIRDNEIVEGEAIETSEPSPMIKIKTKSGIMVVPKDKKLCYSKDELMIHEFYTFFRILGFENMKIRYSITTEEASRYLELTEDKFPEIFI